MDLIVVGRSFLFSFHVVFHIIHSFHSLTLCAQFFLFGFFFFQHLLWPSTLYFSNDPKRHQRIFANGIFLCASMYASAPARTPTHLCRCTHFFEAIRISPNGLSDYKHTVFSISFDLVTLLGCQHLTALTYWCPSIYLPVLFDAIACAMYMCVYEYALSQRSYTVPAFCGSVLKFSPRFRF